MSSGSLPPNTAKYKFRKVQTI